MNKQANFNAKSYRDTTLCIIVILALISNYVFYQIGYHKASQKATVAVYSAFEHASAHQGYWCFTPQGAHILMQMYPKL